MGLYVRAPYHRNVNKTQFQNYNIRFSTFRDNKSTLKLFYGRKINKRRKKQQQYAIWLWILCLSHNKVNNPSCKRNKDEMNIQHTENTQPKKIKERNEIFFSVVHRKICRKWVTQTNTCIDQVKTMFQQILENRPRKGFVDFTPKHRNICASR